MPRPGVALLVPVALRTPAGDVPRASGSLPGAPRRGGGVGVGFAFGFFFRSSSSGSPFRGSSFGGLITLGGGSGFAGAGGAGSGGAGAGAAGAGACSAIGPPPPGGRGI